MMEELFLEIKVGMFPSSSLIFWGTWEALEASEAMRQLEGGSRVALVINALQSLGHVISQFLQFYHNTPKIFAPAELPWMLV